MGHDRTVDREAASALLVDASSRLVRTVDGFHGDDWNAPSLLPEWSRAHVVAHLALNAEGIARALHAVVADEADDGPRTMYDSDEKRDSDILDLAASEPSEIRDRLLAGTTMLDEAIAAIPDAAWETPLERTPGGRVIRARAFPGMRLTEVEIHHVDLGSSYTTADWSTTFARLLLDSMAKRADVPGPFEVAPLDVPDRRWTFGEPVDDIPVVTGPAADIGWWLTGRPAPDTVSCSRGELPSIEGW
jgi:maleylpyruvate isomerase